MMSSPDPAESRRPYRLAGLVYGVFGIVIMAVTVLTPELARPERRADLIHLLIGLPFFVVFALAIAYGDRAVAAVLRPFGADAKAARIGAACQMALTMLLSLSAIGRTLVFAANGVGQRPRLSLNPRSLYLEPSQAEPRMLVNALLMAVIFVFLARAAWWPWLRRQSPKSIPTRIDLGR